MWELLKAGDWPVIPLLLCSVVALGIVLERAWSLQRRRVLPPGLLAEVRGWCLAGEVDADRINRLRAHSPLGRILAAVLMHGGEDRQRQRENVEDTGRHLTLELERYLNALGTLATDPGKRPVCHIFVGSKAPWYEIADALPQFAEFPPRAR